MTVTAWVTYRDERDGTKIIKSSTGHEIQYGGANGDGYCYGHQSFDCIDKLTAEERAAIKGAW